MSCEITFGRRPNGFDDSPLRNFDRVFRPRREQLRGCALSNSFLLMPGRTELLPVRQSAATDVDVCAARARRDACASDSGGDTDAGLREVNSEGTELETFTKREAHKANQWERGVGEALIQSSAPDAWSARAC